MSERLRQTARDIFLEALAGCSIRKALDRLLRVEEGHLHAGDRSYRLASFPDIRILAIGKAGRSLFDAVRPLLPGSSHVRAVISAPSRPRHITERDRYFCGGHPHPNHESMAAARAAVALLTGATAQTLAVFLISGGASAIFETPPVPGVTLADLRELNRRLVGSGAPIAQINTVRKHLSAVKGGRLLAFAGPATCLSLLVSDVPTGQLDALGSGLTLPDSTTVAGCLAVVETYLGGPDGLPASYAHLLAQGLPETPKPGDPAFARAHTVVLLDNAQLLASAGEAARRRGFAVAVENRCDDWEYSDAADFLLEQFQGVAHTAGPVCLLSGGEVTVRLPARPGTGGRNQQWALYCAQRLAASGQTATLLSAGSDGIDGSSPVAGCVADETTWQRARAAGLDPARHLDSFNAYPLFRRLGDTIRSGPTGNNLRDLRILLSGPPASERSAN